MSGLYKRLERPKTLRGSFTIKHELLREAMGGLDVLALSALGWCQVLRAGFFF